VSLSEEQVLFTPGFSQVTSVSGMFGNRLTVSGRFGLREHLAEARCE